MNHAQIFVKLGLTVLENRLTPSAPDFYVNPATGNDANDGLSPGTAWRSWDRLVQAVNDGAVFGGEWVSEATGRPAGIDTIPTTDAKSAWYAEYKRGLLTLTGSRVYLDTSEAPLQVTAPLQLPRGSAIESATSTPAKLEVNVPLSPSEAWFRPDAADAPDVWETNRASYRMTSLYEWQSGGWAQLLPINFDGTAATPADAMDRLESDAGSFWTDAEGHLYTHTLAGGDPNSDGVGRQVVPEWAATLGGGRIVGVVGGLVSGIAGDGGFGYDPTTGQAAGAVGIGSAEWDDISVIESSSWSRAGKHSFEAVGNEAAGLVIFRDDTASQGPGGLFVGYWSHFVDYTSFSGDGSAMSIYDGDRTVDGWANVGRPGGSDALPVYQGLIAHTNDATPAFGERLIEDCHFGGMISLGGPETALAVMQGTIVDGTVTSAAGDSVVDRSRIAFMMPSFTGGTATVTNSIIVPGSVYTSAPADLQGNVTFNFCTFDLTHSGPGYSGAWHRSGPLALSIENSVILDVPNQLYGLIDSVDPSDGVSLDAVVIQGSAAWPMFANYQGVPGRNYSYAAVISGGVKGASVTNTTFVPDAGLDPVTYAPRIDSPAIGRAKPAYGMADYSGVVWPVRRTAGAVEWPWATDAVPAPEPGMLPVDASSMEMAGLAHSE